MNKPRAYTEEETREQVLETIHSFVDYWDNQQPRSELRGLNKV